MKANDDFSLHVMPDGSQAPEGKVVEFKVGDDIDEKLASAGFSQDAINNLVILLYERSRQYVKWNEYDKNGQPVFTDAEQKKYYSTNKSSSSPKKNAENAAQPTSGLETITSSSEDPLTLVDSFTDKEELDTWAASLGVKLDRRKSLESMKDAFKKKYVPGESA